MSTPGERFGADWPAEIRRRAQDRIRTEIRLRHRHEANREIRQLEERVLRRLGDAASLGSVFVFDSFSAIEEFAALSRPELFKLCGEKNVSNVVPYGDEAA